MESGLLVIINWHEKFPTYLGFRVLGDYEEHGTVWTLQEALKKPRLHYILWSDGTELAVAMYEGYEISTVFSYHIPHYSWGITISHVAVEASGGRVANEVCCIMNFHWKDLATVVSCCSWAKIWLAWARQKVASFSFFPLKIEYRQFTDLFNSKIYAGLWT